MSTLQVRVEAELVVVNCDENPIYPESGQSLICSENWQGCLKVVEEVRGHLEVVLHDYHLRVTKVLKSNFSQTCPQRQFQQINSTYITNSQVLSIN